jgi:Spy/CpxP family protein refolding chaperone
MKKIFAIAALIFGAASLSADTTTPPTVPPPPANRPPPSGVGLGGLFNHKVDISKLPADLQALITQFQTQRDVLMAARKALFDSLKGKTEAEKQALIAAFKDANKDAIAAEKALAKQIRDELKALRQEHQKNCPKPNG